MRSDFTDITVVLDRSGSMASCREAAEGGLNEFIASQKGQPGRANLTLVQFDTEYEFVYKGAPIQEVGKCYLKPGGMTALYDAVGRAIEETGERLRRMPEHERPGLVMFLIITDGQENASKRFTSQRIRDMIEHQQNKYSWQFSYLGANQDAFQEGTAMGIQKSSIANYDTRNSVMAFEALSNNATRMRGMSASGQVVCCSYTDSERRSMVAEDADPTQVLPSGWTSGTYADQTQKMSGVNQQ
jgi:hypothetical protein